FSQMVARRKNPLYQRSRGPERDLRDGRGWLERSEDYNNRCESGGMVARWKESRIRKSQLGEDRRPPSPGDLCRGCGRQQHEDVNNEPRLQIFSLVVTRWSIDSLQR